MSHRFRAMLALALTSVGLSEAIASPRRHHQLVASRHVLPSSRAARFGPLRCGMATTASAKLFSIRGGAEELAAGTNLHLQLAGKLLVSRAKPRLRGSQRRRPRTLTTNPACAVLTADPPPPPARAPSPTCRRS